MAIMSHPPYLPSVPVEPEPITMEIHDLLTSIKGLIKASIGPLPTQTGDGTYTDCSVSTGLLKDLQKAGFKDISTLLDILKTKSTGEPTDDRSYLMERIIQVRSSATPHSHARH
jgi:hypothetical protein